MSIESAHRSDSPPELALPLVGADEMAEEDSPSPKTTRPRLSRRAIVLLALLALGGGGWLLVRQLPPPPGAMRNAPVTRGVERKTLTVTVSANGTVKPERTINLSPKTSGVLRELLVKEGDRVQQGQVLAYMDDSNLQGQLTQGIAQVASAEANLQKLRAGNRPEDIAQAEARLTSARSSLQLAETTLQRYQSLANAGAISRSELDQYRTNRDTAQAQVQEAEQALAIVEQGSRLEDINQAIAQVESARGSLQSIQAQLDDTVIRAPFTGIIIRKYADPGAFVTPTTAGSSVSSATSSSILALATNNQVVCNVAENAIARIRLNQVVVLTADAYPGRQLQGQVIQIASQATVEQNVTSFEVKIALKDPDRILRSGMNISAEFQVGQITNALVVPTAAVVRQQSGTGVFILGENRLPVFTPIVTGITVGAETEVKSGLTGTEQVLLSFPPGTRPRSEASAPLPMMTPR